MARNSEVQVICGRCSRSPNDHPSGTCPDGGGSYTFIMADDLVDFLRDNANTPGDQLVGQWLEHLRNKDHKK